MKRKCQIYSKIQLIFLFIVLLSLFSNCKKDKVENKSCKLILLQNKWTPISSWIFFPNGTKYQLLPPISVTFTSDRKEINQSYVGTPSGTIIQEDILAYQLLPNDSTLLFYNITNGVQATNADTATISTLTNHLLVYYSKENNFVNYIDSLQR